MASGVVPIGGDFDDNDEEEDLFSSVDVFVAGAVSGIVAETLAHPFDTVSLRAKVHPSSAYGSFAGSFRLIWAQGMTWR